MDAEKRGHPTREQCAEVCLLVAEALLHVKVAPRFGGTELSDMARVAEMIYAHQGRLLLQAAVYLRTES